MKDDLISRKAAIDKLNAIPSGNWSKERYMRELLNVPSAPAVLLEPLAKWIVENLDPRYQDCEHCSEESVCFDCPMMTEQQVKEKLEKWMEEQDAAD